ncbi:MAG: sulfate adenylyltransferase [Candidatus Abyssobacteria bacterium SURF_5]|uniref:Sulfate adenylyltransferase n=1 Tax=Abyssobacteria bacterium (strain SURF_5) TaxID=2093360 RepID=A0A3A4N7M3_ABYX5|nr:MAG: sulfate adenylyltransferase [Candidatus Abyssubacteria bacterium SURF_5]
MIKPHGGALVSRIVEGREHELLEAQLPQMVSVKLNAREVSDLEMIATGAMSPLEGFMTQDDYVSVLDLMRLAKGLAWTIPITLALKEGDREEAYRPGEDVALYDERNQPLGVLHLEDKYKVDKEREASAVLRTTDEAHPGVKYLQSVGDVYLGGRISLLHRPNHVLFPKYRLDPKETRVLFKAKGWRQVAAFQTRNPIHRAHEYLQKCVLELVDAMLIHPLMGETKGDDIPADVRMRCYEILLEKYYPKTRVALSIFPAAMRYAGPREAIFHALIRKNYGCTHFIVGRDHAGVGSYYGPYDAQYIFHEFEPEELGISPLFFENAFFCRACNGMASAKTCPHDTKEHIVLSGTKVREMLRNGMAPPPEFTRPEVADVLIQAFRRSQ